MKSLGILTIGQSPRPDVVEVMVPYIGENIKIIERGALDGLTLDQVKEFAPEKGMMPLVTRMSDGSEVLIAKEKILFRIKRIIGEFNEYNVSLILLLCVSTFPPFESACLVVHSQRIVDQCIESLINKTNHLGIIIPVKEQQALVRERFSRATPLITVTDASPYGDLNRISQASKALKESNCDLIVMYCMGFTRGLAKEVRLATGKPVILSSSLVARTIGELLE